VVPGSRSTYFLELTSEQDSHIDDTLSDYILELILPLCKIFGVIEDFSSYYSTESRRIRVTSSDKNSKKIDMYLSSDRVLSADSLVAATRCKAPTLSP